MAALILINDTKAQSQSGPQMFRAGSTISDPAAQAAIIAEGGFLWPATDPVIAATAIIVQKLRTQGMDEAFCARAMLAGVGNSLLQGSGGDGLAVYQKVLDALPATATAETTFGLGSIFTGTLVNSVYFVPGAAVTASDTNYATITVQKRTAGGAATTIASGSTTLTVGTPLGNFTAFVPVLLPLSVPNISLLASDVLTFNITKTGTGVVLPASTIAVYGG